MPVKSLTPLSTGLSDKQAFEYSDIFTLPVSKSTYGNSHIGDVVKVEDTYGVLQSEIALTAAEIDALAKVAGFNPATLPFGGGNAEGFASVRVKNGAYRLSVKHTGAAGIGKAVYVKNSVAGGKSEVTTDSAAATQIGFLLDALPADGNEHTVRVALTIN